MFRSSLGLSVALSRGQCSCSEGGVSGVRKGGGEVYDERSGKCNIGWRGWECGGPSQAFAMGIWIGFLGLDF